MPASCELCLYQGTKKELEEKGMCTFCLVKGNWMPVSKKCSNYRDYDPNLPPDIKNMLALNVRLEESENKRLKSVIRSTRFSMIIAFIFAFALFIAVAKFYDKFLF